MNPSRRSPRLLLAARALPCGLPCALLFALLMLFAVRPAHAQEPAAAPDAIPPAQAALRINEFMASNNSFFIDPAQPERTPDWVEIYNPGVAAVDLKGLSLSDDPNKPDKRPFTQTVTVPAGGFLVLFEGADNNDVPISPRHFNFGLSAGGESVGLYLTATGEKVDEYTYGAQTTDVSEGRSVDGAGVWKFFTLPTPFESNGKNAPNISAVQRSITQPQPGNTVQVSAVITDNGTIVSASLVYTAAPAGPATLALVKGSGDTWQATIPGFPNGTFVAYEVRATDNEINSSRSRRDGYVVGYVAPTLRINEFMAENPTFLEDPDEPGEFPDWMELYNPTGAAIPLDGLYLSDDPLDPTKSPFPAGLSVPAGSILLIILDDDPEQGPRHAAIQLNKDGELLGLFGAQGTVRIDGLTFGKQFDNVAMGRLPDGAGAPNDAAAFVQLVCPTPGKANLACDQKSYMPTVLVPPAPAQQ